MESSHDHGAKAYGFHLDASIGTPASLQRLHGKESYIFQLVGVDLHVFIVLVEAAVDDEVAVEQRPLTLNVFEHSELPRLVVKAAGVLEANT